MATCKIMASDEFALKLSLAATESDNIAKKAIFVGSKITIEEMRTNLEMSLSDEATGETSAAMGITPITIMGGQWSAHVGFDGYNSKGVPFLLIARVLESGNSTHRKKPFVRPTLRQIRRYVQSEMGRVIEEETKKILD